MVNDGKGEPFGEGEEGGGQSAPDVPSEFGFYSILALDMSDSIFNNDAVDSVIDGAQVFVQKMVVEPEPDQKHHVALLVFGRTDTIQVVLSFTDDATALHNKLEELRAGESLGTTNLYGAYMKALEEVVSVGKELELVERSVVILTDGTHEAGNEEKLRQQALDAKRMAEDTGTINVFSIGIKGNYTQEKLEELASKPDYFALADNAASLEEVFQDVAERVEAIARSNYVVGVCTPVELGSPTMTIRVEVDGAGGEVTVGYSTDELNGDLANCDKDAIAKPCEDLECGTGHLPGFTCGTCDACGTECQGGFCTFTACEGKFCGDDGCGDVCGGCGGTQDECIDNECVCQPDCDEKVCGTDGCDGSCGECTGDQIECEEGQCICQPLCEGKGCGDDGCEGVCGECDVLETCAEDQCVCSWLECGGVCCQDEQVCADETCCTPDCKDKECGNDGCGDVCGQCLGPQDKCIEGQCVCEPDCQGKECGDDGCGDVCGTCDAPKVCSDHHCGCPWIECGNLCCEEKQVCAGEECCSPNCDGLQCGDDGCGDSCADCPGPQDVCVEGVCECVPTCEDKECGDDGCGGGCGQCQGSTVCNVWGKCVEQIGAEVVNIPAGSFWMGCNDVVDLSCAGSQLPEHLVEVPEFYIDATEATNASYVECVANGSCTEPSFAAAGEWCHNWDAPENAQFPVRCVGLAQASQFCQWSGKRLCSEAEWEKAARGGCELYGDDCKASMPTYPWGNETPTCDQAVTADCGGPVKVGTSPNGASPYGVFEMSGNVSEWVADCWHGNYEGAPDKGGVWDYDCGVYHVKRGGDYVHYAGFAKATTRTPTDEEDTLLGARDIGVRCCGPQ